MQMSYLFFLKFEFSKRENSMLILSPKYISLTILSNATYNYSMLITAEVCYPKQLKRQEFMYTQKKLRVEK